MYFVQIWTYVFFNTLLNVIEMLQSKANSNLLNSHPQKEESSQKDRKKALRLTKKKKTAKKKESLETK